MNTLTAIVWGGLWFLDRLTGHVFRAVQARRLAAAKAAREAAK